MEFIQSIQQGRSFANKCSEYAGANEIKVNQKRKEVGQHTDNVRAAM